MADRPPSRVRDVLAEIAGDSTMNDGIEALAARASEFDSTLAARLTGVALNPLARLHFHNALDEMWAGTTAPREVPEIVVGSGLHAAIYCAVRVAQGHPKPLVIEASDRVGGAFAASKLPAFYLNSRNRPGNLGIPGREEGLNYLPGAIIQPADLGIAEYQVNTDLAFTIRASLALNARVLTGTRVDRALTSGGPTGVLTTAGDRINAKRVIFATGLGKPRVPEIADGKYLMDYMQFLNHLDNRFPFEGVKSVAVIGAADSGRTAIEALIGQGPANRMSLASLDWVEKIDWYGVQPACRTRDGWIAGNRSRYKGIGRVLPTTADGPARVQPITRRADQFGIGYNGAYVDGARYDLVILATGFDQPRPYLQQPQHSVGGRVVARRDNADGLGEVEVFVVGPAANLETDGEANLLAQVPENSAAVWRYADRTAALAMSLPATAVEEREREVVKVDDEAKPKRRLRKKPSKSSPANWSRGDRIRRREDGLLATVNKVNGTSVSINNGPGLTRNISAGLWEYIG